MRPKVGAYADMTNRQTGRTTRMVAEAVNQLIAGNDVTIVGPDGSVAANIMRLLETALCGIERRRTASTITITESGATARVLCADEVDTLRGHNLSSVLVDHTVPVEHELYIRWHGWIPRSTP